MELHELELFPPEVAERLRTYVDRLIDPRNGETFYVGKGKGNRVFHHVRAEDTLDGDSADNKMKRIREIRLAGFKVAHVIHRHGLEDVTALQVEAALIDAYPGLTNVAGGAGGDEFGVMHAMEIIRAYSAEPAVFRHKALLISVKLSAAERSVYEATRYAWKINRTKAEEAEVVLATVKGMIVGAFIADNWLPATPKNFAGRADGEGEPDRLGFVGHEAPDVIKRDYVGKRVPEEYRRPGAANPIRYS